MTLFTGSERGNSHASLPLLRSRGITSETDAGVKIFPGYPCRLRGCLRGTWGGRGRQRRTSGTQRTRKDRTSSGSLLASVAPGESWNHDRAQMALASSRTVQKRYKLRNDYACLSGEHPPLTIPAAKWGIHRIDLPLSLRLHEFMGGGFRGAAPWGVGGRVS
jgi:hypothetical protein